MNPYIIAVIVLIILGLLAFDIYYYLKKHRKQGSPEDEYIWVGSGEHPFKKKEGENN